MPTADIIAGRLAAEAYAAQGDAELGELGRAAVERGEDQAPSG